LHREEFRIFAESEHAIQVVSISPDPGYLNFVSREEEGSLLAVRCRLDLNQPICAIDLKGTDVEAGTGTLGYGNVLNSVGETRLPELMQSRALESEHERFARKAK
jgi:hypothetical protein